QQLPDRRLSNRVEPWRSHRLTAFDRSAHGRGDETSCPERGPGRDGADPPDHHHRPQRITKDVSHRKRQERATEVNGQPDNDRRQGKTEIANWRGHHAGPLTVNSSHSPSSAILASLGRPST